MKKRFFYDIIWALSGISVLFFNSCVGKHLLKNGEYLYGGAKIEIHSDTVISGKKKLAGILKDETYPLTNSKMAGLPVKLWVYSLFGPGYIGDNYGERPVLMSDVPVDEVKESLHTVLKANGYLDSRVEATIKKSSFFKHQQQITYHAYLQPPYYLGTIKHDIPDSAVSFLIDSLKQKSRLHPDDQYNLAKLKEERERIDKILKNRGYYYFSPNYLYYVGDSTIGKRHINLLMKLYNDVDPTDIKPWTITKITVVEKASSDTLPYKDTTRVDGVDFIMSKFFNPKILRHFILFHPNDLLTSENYNITNRNLSALVAFLYVNIDAVPDTTEDNKLSIVITITPQKRNHIQAEAGVVSKSNNFAGPNVGLSFVNRNLLGGSEQLTIKVSGSVEAFLQKQNSKMLGRFSYEAGSSAELRFPRFLFFNQSLFSARYTPSNYIRLEGRLTDQVQYYRMSFMNAAYGFRWTETSTKRHEFNLISLSYQHTLQRTDIYDSLLNINPLLKQSFADQFIIGSNYSYQYALPERDKRIFKSAFTGTVDLSGNLLYGLQKAFGMKSENGEPMKFLGAIYSQYVRATLDYRVYIKLLPFDQIATRLNIGAGIPLGNSSTLPAIKQFYLGGANTIRAFPFRSVGPGAYSTTASGDKILINHTGEIELLGSIENRLRFAKRLELALFMDAGNIWIVRNDPLRENAQFNNSFYKQLAVGWGYGLRYLNDFFTLRVDVGMPMHSPNTFDKISDMKPTFNFAIGYPF